MSGAAISSLTVRHNRLYSIPEHRTRMGNAFLLLLNTWPLSLLKVKHREHKMWSIYDSTSSASSTHNSTYARDLVTDSIFYAEWGRKIVEVSWIARAYHWQEMIGKFPGLVKCNMIAISTPDGHGSHDCLINRRNGEILGIVYNNRADKLAMLIEFFPGVLAEIIVSYVHPTHPSPGLKPWMYQPSGGPLYMSRARSASVKLKMIR